MQSTETIEKNKITRLYANKVKPKNPQQSYLSLLLPQALFLILSWIPTQKKRLPSDPSVSPFQLASPPLPEDPSFSLLPFFQQPFSLPRSGKLAPAPLFPAQPVWSPNHRHDSSHLLRHASPCSCCFKELVPHSKRPPPGAPKVAGKAPND